MQNQQNISDPFLPNLSNNDYQNWYQENNEMEIIEDDNFVEQKYSALSKISKIISVFFGCNAVLLLILITGFFFSAYYSDKNTDLKGIIQYLDENINKLPISNIEVQATTCRGGWERLKIFDYRGTNQGCLCGSQVSTDCESSNCTKIPKTYTQKLYKWKEYNFCVQRISLYKYQTTECPSNYKRCNPNLCVHNNDPNGCPITLIRKILTDDADYRQYAEGSDGEIYINSQEKLFFWKTLNEVQTFNGFTVTLDQTPCLDSSKDPMLPSQYAKYPLYNSDYDCGDYGMDSNNSYLTDTHTNFYNFLTYNGMTSDLSSLTNFQNYVEDYVLDLYMRYSITFNRESSDCTKFSYSDYSQLGPIRESILQTSLICFILKYIFFTGFFLCIIIECCKNKTQIQKIIPGVSITLQLCVFVLITIAFFEEYYLYYYYSQKDEIKDFYISFGENQCFGDANINDLFSKIDKLFSDEMESYYTIVMVSFFWGGILFCVLFFMHSIECFLFCFKGYGSYKQVLRERRKTKRLKNLKKNPYSIHDQNMGLNNTSLQKINQQYSLPQQEFEMAYQQPYIQSLCLNYNYNQNLCFQYFFFFSILFFLKYINYNNIYFIIIIISAQRLQQQQMYNDIDQQQQQFNPFINSNLQQQNQQQFQPYIQQQQQSIQNSSKNTSNRKNTSQQKLNKSQSVNALQNNNQIIQQYQEYEEDDDYDDEEPQFDDDQYNNQKKKK